MIKSAVAHGLLQGVLGEASFSEARQIIVLGIAGQLLMRLQEETRLSRCNELLQQGSALSPSTAAGHSSGFKVPMGRQRPKTAESQDNEASPQLVCKGKPKTNDLRVVFRYRPNPVLPRVLITCSTFTCYFGGPWSKEICYVPILAQLKPSYDCPSQAASKKPLVVPRSGKVEGLGPSEPLKPHELPKVNSDNWASYTFENQSLFAVGAQLKCNQESSSCHPGI